MKSPKKLFRIFGITILSIFLLIVIIVGVATIFEDELADYTVAQFEKEIHAPISIGKVSVNPIFSFPRLSLEINEFTIGYSDDDNKDTLFFINSLKAGLDSWDLIHGIFTLHKMEISDLEFDYNVDEKGRSNIDFILDIFSDSIPDKPVKDQQSPINFTAEKFNLKKITINYLDSLNKIGSQIYIPEINLKLKGENNKFKGNSRGSFVLSNCFYDSIPIDKMQSCSFNYNVDIDDNQININDLLIKSEGIEINVEGLFDYGNILKADAIIKLEHIDFNILKKYFPEFINDYFSTEEELFTTDLLKLKLKMDYEDSIANISDLDLSSDGINLNFTGVVGLANEISVYGKLNKSVFDFSILKKYIPEKYISDYGISNLGGIANITAIINGSFSDSTSIPLIDADLSLNKFNTKLNIYPEIEGINLITSISSGSKADLSEAKINISELSIKSAESSVLMNGKISNLPMPDYDLSAGLNINLSELKNILPESLLKNATGVMSGNIKTNGTLKNVIDDKFIDDLLGKTALNLNFNNVSATIVDSIELNSVYSNIEYHPLDKTNKEFNISNLNLKSKTYNLNIENSSFLGNLSGKLSDPSNINLSLNSFNIQSGNNLIIGEAKINNLNKPEYELNTTLILNLEELVDLLPDSLINDMKGIVKAKVQSKGIINPDSIENQINEIAFENSSLDLICNNVSVSFPDTLMNFKNLSSSLSMRDDKLEIEHLGVKYNGLKIQLDSSTVQNFYKTLILNQKEQLFIDAYLKTGDINFNDFKKFMLSDEAPNSEEEIAKPFNQQWTYLIHGSFAANSLNIDSTEIEGFNINSLHLNNISSLFKLSDSAYIIDQFKFKVFDGELTNSMHYKIREDGTESVSAHNIIEGIDVRKMLRDLDHFGMDSLINYKNISGLLSADLNSFTPIDDSVLINRILLSGDIMLEKGGVYDYPPAQELSRFTNIKELDNIQFKTLKSSVFLFKNKLYVPRTEIVSNAIDIAAFGMQSMLDESEYHLELHLSNILFGKSKRRNKKQNESGEEIDEKSLKKSSQKIRYSTNGGKSKVVKDNKDSREDMMNKIRVQQKMLDFIFFPKNIHYNTELK